MSDVTRIPGEEIELVLLDMGGVLVDMRRAHGLPTGDVDRRGRRAIIDRLERAGGSVDEPALDELLFEPWRRGYRRRYETEREEPWEPHLERLIAAAGADVAPLEVLACWFAPYAERLRPAPAAHDVVARLAGSGRELGLVSNVPLPGTFYATLLREWGIAQHLGHLAFSYDVGRRKPAPTMIDTSLERFGVDATRALMVGDRRGSDVAAGRAAGVWTAWLRSEDRGGPSPDASIESLEQLPALVGSSR